MTMADVQLLDVREMLCAQALAVVARAMALLGRGRSLAVRYNSEDVKSDLLTWAATQGYDAGDDDPGRLELTKR